MKYGVTDYVSSCQEIASGPTQNGPCPWRPAWNVNVPEDRVQVDRGFMTCTGRSAWTDRLVVLELPLHYARTGTTWTVDVTLESQRTAPLLFGPDEPDAFINRQGYRQPKKSRSRYGWSAALLQLREAGSQIRKAQRYVERSLFETRQESNLRLPA